MADLNDILGKTKKIQQLEQIDLDGICEECFWPLNHGFYNKDAKKLKVVCVNDHERTLDWDMGDG